MAMTTVDKDGKNLSTFDNQATYLQKLQVSGTPGQRTWATGQLAGYTNPVYNPDGGVSASNPHKTLTKPGVNPTTLSSPTNQFAGIGEKMYSAREALLRQNLGNTMNTLDKNYNTSKMEYGLQQGDVNRKADQNLEDINQDVYRNMERGKVTGVNRGLTNTNQQMGVEQGMIRSGNSDKNQVTIARNEALNDILTRINNLTQNYGSDKVNAQNNFNTGKEGALAESQLAQLQTDMNMYQFNQGFLNQKELANMGFANANKMQQAGFGHDVTMQDDSQAFAAEQQTAQFKQEELMFGKSAALQMAMQRVSEAGANARNASSNSLAQQRFDWEKEQYGLEKADEKDLAKQAFLFNSMQQNKDWNPAATSLGGWDAFTPWKTQNEKSYALNQNFYSQNAALAGLSPTEINNMLGGMYDQSWMYNNFQNGNNANAQSAYMQRMMNNSYGY